MCGLLMAYQPMMEPKLNVKVSAYSPVDGMAITEEGTNRSAQHGEVRAALLPIRQT